MILETVETDIVIRQNHSPRTWHASLPNGKLVIAFVPESQQPPALEAGAKVRARLTVTDFSRALIIAA